MTRRCCVFLRVSPAREGGAAWDVYPKGRRFCGALWPARMVACTVSACQLYATSLYVLCAWWCLAGCGRVLRRVLRRSGAALCLMLFVVTPVSACWQAVALFVCVCDVFLGGCLWRCGPLFQTFVQELVCVRITLDVLSTFFSASQVRPATRSTLRPPQRATRRIPVPARHLGVGSPA